MTGPTAGYAIAWCRGGGAITVLTRTGTVLDRAGGWGQTALSLPPGQFADRLGGGTWQGNVLLGDVLAGLPVALLVAEEPR